MDEEDGGRRLVDKEGVGRGESLWVRLNHDVGRILGG